MAKRKRKNKYKSKNKRDRLNMDKGGVVRNPYNKGSLAINPLQPLDPRPNANDDGPGYSSPPDYRVMGNTVNQGVTVQDRGTGIDKMINYGPGSVPGNPRQIVQPGRRQPPSPPSTPPAGPSASAVSDKGMLDENRQTRVEDTGLRAEELARGNLDLGSDTQIPTPRSIGRRGTELDLDDPRYQMQGQYGAGSQDVNAITEDVSTQTARQANLRQDPTTVRAGIERVRDDGPRLTAAQTEARGVRPLADQTLTDTRDFGNIDAVEAEVGKAKDINGVISAGGFVPEVVGAGAQVEGTRGAELRTRNAIVDSNAVGRQASEIIGTLGYEASKQRKVTGQAAIGGAATMIAQTALIPEDIAAAIVEDPATVEAQVDTNPVEVNAAIAALPSEALVSSQMESLLGGMEDGQVPTWAKPAVDSVNANMARRGLTASTVGRDALFNAIIQSSLPIAQNNAQALQQRAAQNLNNEQTANLQQAKQEQQLRMANLANRQTAESQTAQYAQQMGVMQSQFNQQAVMTTAQQQQQTAMANLQNQQQAAVINVQNRQAINSQNLGNQQQINLAELQIEATQEGANQTAENQRRLVEMQTAADFMSKNAAFKQDMDKANLSAEQQIRLANLSAQNQASSESLSAQQQSELANLNKRLQTNLNNAQLAQSLGLAQLNVDQQRAMTNAQIQSGMDMANFNADQQRELANSKFMQSVTLENMNAEQQSIMQEATALAQLDVANLGVRERLRVENAKNFLSYDMANLTNDQQARVMKAQQEQQRLLSDQAAFNAAEQFNATNENQVNQFMTQLSAQMEQYNTSAVNNMKQFNSQALNAAEARRAGNTLQADSLTAQMALDAEKFSSQQLSARDQFNATQSSVIAQSNVDWRRKANTADTAAFNAVNQQNAQNAFNLTASANNFLWQELRDEADFAFKRYDNDQQRKTSLLVAALGNEQGVNEKGKWDDNITALYNVFSGFLD